MKCMKRWLGIMLSVMLAAGSLQVPVYAAETGETAAEAAVEEFIEIADELEAEEPKVILAEEEPAEEPSGEMDSADEAVKEEAIKDETIKDEVVEEEAEYGTIEDIGTPEAAQGQTEDDVELPMNNADSEIFDEAAAEAVKDKEQAIDEGETIGSIWLSDITPVETSGYYYYDEQIRNIERSDYSCAVEFDASYNTSAKFDLFGLYDSFTGTVCTGVNTGSGVFTMSIYGDGELLREISSVSHDNNNYTLFKVDVSGVKELEIRSENSGSWANGWVYIADGLLVKYQNENGIPDLEWQEHIFRVITHTASFGQAEEECEAIGGHLATIMSAEENNAIAQYLRTFYMGGSYMIGLYDAAGSEGQWDTWVTGEPVTYSNWGSGQPDWTGQTICAINTEANTSYGWDVGEWDNGWDGDFHFICEWDDSNVLSPEVIEIFTAEDLKNVSNNLSGHYRLMEDINLSVLEEDWEPIGNDDPFTGTFDGNGHTINNLRIDNDGYYQGLFGITDGAAIEKLSVNGIIHGGTFVGGIVGLCQNTELSYCINNVSAEGTDQIGAIAGRLAGGSINYCMNTAAVTASSRGCGGITGDIYPSGSVANCLNLGNVFGGNDLTGGITGGSTDGSIAACVNAGDVTCQRGRAGAIAGDNASYAGERENNYFLQTEEINAGYGVVGEESGTFASITDEKVTGLKKIIFSGNGTSGRVQIKLDDIYAGNVGKELYISVEISSNTLSPDSSNMTWRITSADHNVGDSSIEWGSLSVITAGEDSYIASKPVTISAAGKFNLTVSFGGTTGTAEVVISNGNLKITPASTKKGYSYAGNVKADNTFTMTLDKSEETPQKSDFHFNIKRTDNLTETPSQSVSDPDVEIKDIKETSDRKYEISFSYKPDETGFYGLTVTYKDNIDDTELMVYDSNLLEKLEKDLDKTVKSYYTSYGKRVKAEVNRVKKEENKKTDYVLLAQELMKDSSNLMNGTAIGDPNVDADSVRLCAFEAYGRSIENVLSNKGIKFDEIDNDTAVTNITNAVINYLRINANNSKKEIMLDSKAVIDGKEYDVKASWIILVKSGSIKLIVEDHGREIGQYMYSITTQKQIESSVADYLNALKELNKSGWENAAEEYYGALVDLLGWDILEEIDAERQEVLKEAADDIIEALESHGIKNIVDNVKTGRNYYKQAKQILDKVKNAKTVIKSGTTKPTDKLTSIYEITNINTNTAECGDCSKDIYELLKQSEEKWRDYMKEYFTTGTIKDLETENLLDTMQNGLKNIFKCPVSITVIDPSGQTVGYVGDDDLWFSDPIFIEEEGEAKIIYTPKEAGYVFDVVGTDDGQVSYTVKGLTDGNFTGEYFNYYDIQVEKGTRIHVEILNDSVHSSNDVSVTCEEEVFQPEVSDITTVKNVHVNYDSDKGTVTGSGSFMAGDMATVIAEPLEGHYFGGWYDGDDLKTFSKEYQFEVRKDMTLTATFSPINYEEPEEEVDITDAEVSGIINKKYTGSPIEQSITVKSDGIELSAGTDYKVEYSDNTNPGTATVTIKGIGNYIGSITRTFLILPGKTTRGDMFNLANNVKVTWKEVPGAKYYKVYREGITDKKETQKEPVIVTERLIGWDSKPGLTNGHAYRYKVVASLTGAGDSSGDSTLSYSKLMYRLKTVVIRSAKNTAPGKVTVKYDKTTSGDSYVLQYCERQDMVGAKTKVVLGANSTSYVIGGLKKGKTYYISIRVRKKVNGIDYYTTFGVPKKVIITK